MTVKADPIFYKRFSPRSFKQTDINQRDLMKLFEAARWAASSYNEQPWRFIYASKVDRKNFDRLLSCLSDSNQKWAIEAPLLMMTVAKTYFSENHTFNRHSMHDLGLAMGNLILQASISGIMVHQMAGFNRNKAKRKFELPEGFEPIAMVAMGYSDEEKNDRTRKLLKDIVFTANQKIGS